MFAKSFQFHQLLLSRWLLLSDLNRALFRQVAPTNLNYIYYIELARDKATWHMLVFDAGHVKADLFSLVLHKPPALVEKEQPSCISFESW